MIVNIELRDTKECDDCPCLNVGELDTDCNLDYFDDGEVIWKRYTQAEQESKRICYGIGYYQRPQKCIEECGE